MRPAGPVRQAVQQAAWDLAVERATGAVRGATWRELADVLVPRGFSRSAVRSTLKNMAHARHVRPVATRTVTDSCRPLVAYAPAQLAGPTPQVPGEALAHAMRAWAPAG